MKKVLVLAAMALAVSSVVMAQEGDKSCCKKGKKECTKKSCSKDKKATNATSKAVKPVATPAPATSGR